MSKISEVEKMDKSPYADVAYIKNVTKRLTRNNKPYYSGNLIASDKKDYSFKIWDGGLGEVFLDAIKNSEENDSLIVNISGEINIYQGMTSVIIRQSSNYDGSLQLTDFLTSDYDVSNLMKRLVGSYHETVSEKALNLIKSVLTSNTAKEFAMTVAALSHHDNQIHGLLAHTTKMEEIGHTVISNYPALFKSQDDIDLFLVGILFHDLGKTKEYTAFRASNEAFLSHRYLGVRMIEPYEEQIVSAYNHEWYDHLIAILLQHHGIYEERPKTVMAYAVHLVDMMESSMASLNQDLAGANENEEDHVFEQASDGSRFGLTIYRGDEDRQE